MFQVNAQGQKAVLGQGLCWLARPLQFAAADFRLRRQDLNRPSDDREPPGLHKPNHGTGRKQSDYQLHTEQAAPGGPGKGSDAFWRERLPRKRRLFGRYVHKGIFLIAVRRSDVTDVRSKKSLKLARVGSSPHCSTAFLRSRIGELSPWNFSRPRHISTTGDSKQLPIHRTRFLQEDKAK